MKRVEDTAARELLDGANKVYKDAWQALYIYAASLAVILLLTGYISWQVISSIVGPVTRLTGAMKRLASDEQNVEVPDTGRRDEFGEMAATVQVFKENGDKIRGFQGELEEREKRAQQEKEDAISAVKDGEAERAAAVATGFRGIGRTRRLHEAHQPCLRTPDFVGDDDPVSSGKRGALIYWHHP